MTTIENPPAFPVTAELVNSYEVLPTFPGMSLRDWFAGQALAVVWQTAFDLPGRDPSPAPMAALLAYEMADAMLAARVAKP